MSSGARSPGKGWGKLIRLIALGTALFLTFILLASIVFYVKRDWIFDQILAQAAEGQSGELEIDGIELAIFKHLPNITVSLENVRYYEKKDSLRKVGELPIVYARDLYLAFEPLPFIASGILKVSNVSLEGGELNIIEYGDGKLNLELALLNPRLAGPIKGKELKTLKNIRGTRARPIEGSQPSPRVVAVDQSKSRSFEFRIKKIDLHDILLTHRNDTKGRQSAVDFRSLQGQIELGDKGFSCQLKSFFEITGSSRLPGITLLGPTQLDVELKYVDSSKTFLMREGSFRFGDVKVNMSGNYQIVGNRMLDMSLQASADDLKILSKLIQKDVLNQNRSLVQQATVDLRGRIYGESRTRFPMVDLDFSIRNLSLNLAQNIGNFENVGLQGEFHSGDSADFSQAKIVLKNLKGKIPGGMIEGEFLLTNFQEPYVKSNLYLQTSVENYDKIFRIPNISDLQGRLEVKAKYDGFLKGEDQQLRDSLSAWSIALDGLGFIYTPTKRSISNLNGIFEAKSNELVISDFGFRYDSSDLSIAGSIENVYPFLFDKKNKLEASLSLHSDQLISRDLLLNGELTARIEDRVSDLDLNINLRSKFEDESVENYQGFDFDIEGMTFVLDKLPGVSVLNTSGSIYRISEGLRLDLNDFHADLKSGQVDLVGNLFIHGKEKVLTINSDIRISDFPTNYIDDLIRALQGEKLGNAKNMALSEMTLLNTHLNISSVLDLRPFAVPMLHMTSSDIRITTRDSLNYEVGGVNLDLADLRFIHEDESDRITGIESVRGVLDAASILAPPIKKSSLKLTITGLENIVNADFSMLNKLTSGESGKIVFDMTEGVPKYTVNYRIEDIPVESIVEEYYPEKLIEGKCDAVFFLKGQGTKWSSFSKSATGSIEISGDSLLLFGIDIDDILQKFENSQNFRLVDLGAIMLAGPMGALVTKGSDFGKLATIQMNSSKRTEIKQILGKWSIGDGVVQTEDVAFSTSLNRLAFFGRFDFVNDTIPGYTAYVLDRRGCSLMDQRVYGKMNDLRVDKLNISETLFGSVVNFVNALVGKNCKPVYTGEVAHPN